VSLGVDEDDPVRRVFEDGGEPRALACETVAGDGVGQPARDDRHHDREILRRWIGLRDDEREHADELGGGDERSAAEASCRDAGQEAAELGGLGLARVVDDLRDPGAGRAARCAGRVARDRRDRIGHVRWQMPAAREVELALRRVDKEDRRRGGVRWADDLVEHGVRQLGDLRSPRHGRRDAIRG
jgi:hypothetical protein